MFKTMAVSHAEVMTKGGCSDLFPTVPSHLGILRAEGFLRVNSCRNLLLSIQLKFVLNLKEYININEFFIVFIILF